jgi:hypothetical protein
MGLLVISLFLLDPQPGPYVSLYKDDAVTFQIRREPITPHAENVYTVRLRWLWAQPRPWKSHEEAATIINADLDCNRQRVREISVLHRDRDGKYFDEEKKDPKTETWKTFPPGSATAAALKLACRLIPEIRSR